MTIFNQLLMELHSQIAPPFEEKENWSQMLCLAWLGLAWLGLAKLHYFSGLGCGLCWAAQSHRFFSVSAGFHPLCFDFWGIGPPWCGPGPDWVAVSGQTLVIYCLHFGVPANCDLIAFHVLANCDNCFFITAWCDLFSVRSAGCKEEKQALLPYLFSEGILFHFLFNRLCCVYLSANAISLWWTDWCLLCQCRKI